MSLVLVTPPAGSPLSIEEIKQYLRLDATNVEPAPPALNAALAGAGAGNVNAGDHRYLATFSTATGETNAGVPSAAVVATGGDGKVQLTQIPIGGSGVASRKLYRTKAGGSVYYLLATLADNVTVEYLDNVADAALGVGAPAINTTSDPLLDLILAGIVRTAERITRRALLTQTWALKLDCFHWTEAIWLPKPRLQAVLSIQYIDPAGVLQTLDPAEYLVDADSEPARIMPAWGKCWPMIRPQMNAVTVTYRCGYGVAADIPAEVKNWMLARLMGLWENRKNLETNTGERFELPHSHIDGLLDGARVPDFRWAA